MIPTPQTIPLPAPILLFPSERSGKIESPFLFQPVVLSPSPFLPTRQCSGECRGARRREREAESLSGGGKRECAPKVPVPFFHTVEKMRPKSPLFFAVAAAAVVLVSAAAVAGGEKHHHHHKKHQRQQHQLARQRQRRHPAGGYFSPIPNFFWQEPILFLHCFGG